MTVFEYYEECLADSCEEHGVEINAEQLKAVADDMRRAHEMKSEAFGTPQGNPEREEIKRLERALQTERDKSTCPECKGTGQIVFQGPYHGSQSQCDRCRGQGRC